MNRNTRLCSCRLMHTVPGVEAHQDGKVIADGPPLEPEVALAPVLGHLAIITNFNRVWLQVVVVAHEKRRTLSLPCTQVNVRAGNLKQ